MIVIPSSVGMEVYRDSTSSSVRRGSYILIYWMELCQDN